MVFKWWYIFFMLVVKSTELKKVLSSPVIDNNKSNLIKEHFHASYAEQAEPEDAGKPLLQCYTCSLSESAKVCRGNQNLVPCPGRNAVCRTTFIYSDVLINGTTMQKFNKKYIKTCDTLARTDACEFVCYNYATDGKTCKTQCCNTRACNAHIGSFDEEHQPKVSESSTMFLRKNSFSAASRMMTAATFILPIFLGIFVV